MKKSILVTLVIASLTLVASLSGYAQTIFNASADTSKEGSLLIWPLVQTNDGNETYIVIMNSGLAADGNDTDQNINIKCYWEYRPYDSEGGTYCGMMDTAFVMSANNPLVIKASSGTGLEDGRGIMSGIGEGVKGSLKCWAVESSDRNQIAWNHLSGSAYIVTDDNRTAWQYNAWRFAANILNKNDGDNETSYVDGFWVGKTEDATGAFNAMLLKGAVAVVTANVGVTPVCPAVPVKWAGYYTFRAIPFKRTFPTNPAIPVEISYYCVPQVNPDNCTLADSYYNEGCYIKDGIYDACPKYLTFDFLAEPSSVGTDGYAYNHLTLLPCREDLRYDGDEATAGFDFVTRLSFSVWNENEVKYTGMQYCAHCDGSGLTGHLGGYESYLGNLKVGGLNFFQQKYLHTPSGRFRVEGKSATETGICGSGGAKPTALIGVMSSRLVNMGMASRDIVGTTPSISAPETAINMGYIRWDPSTDVSKKRR